MTLSDENASGDTIDRSPEIADIQAMAAALPDRDHRSPEEIIGYDELGLPS
jgi:hypothetical protein